jgi:hypothetical protein
MSFGLFAKKHYCPRLALASSLKLVSFNWRSFIQNLVIERVKKERLYK